MINFITLQLNNTYLVFRSNSLGLLGGEAAALDEGVDVGTILHQHVIVHGLNQTPELLLDGLWRNHLRKSNKKHDNGFS